MKNKFLNTLARVCAKLAELFTDAERRLAVCPDCGRNRFYGKPCKN